MKKKADVGSTTSEEIKWDPIEDIANNPLTEIQLKYRNGRKNIPGLPPNDVWKIGTIWKPRYYRFKWVFLLFSSVMIAYALSVLVMLGNDRIHINGVTFPSVASLAIIITSLVLSVVGFILFSRSGETQAE